jgi:hypothetical protein
MPAVIDESVEVHERRTRGDIEHDIGRFGLSARRNTLRSVSMWIVFLMIRSGGVGDPAPPYILWRDRVTRKISYSVLYNI